MFIFIVFVLFIAVLAVFALAYHIRRARARAKADRIIAGKEKTTATEINRCITILTSADAWLVGRAIQDQLRIDKLRDIRNALIK